MNTKQIKYFLEIVDWGSYSAAAKSLAVTQPTLSIAMQKLEEELGFSLFSYNQKNLCLTNNGHAFYQYAREYMDAYNHMVDASVNIRKGIVGTVTIIASPTIVRHYLGDMLCTYHERYPDVEINVCARNALYDSLEMLNRNEADFCLRSLPIDTYQYAYRTLDRQTLVLGVHKSHPLAKKDTVDFADLQKETFLDTGYDYNLHRQFMRNCENAGFTPTISMRSNDMDFLASLVERKWGVFLLPRTLWEKQQLKNVKLLEVTGADVDWELGMVYLKEAPMSRACKALLDLSKEYVG